MEEQNQNIQNFLYPRRRYHGQFTPEALVFNANLQEFSQRVSYICNLQTRGKLSPEESYHQISDLWKDVKLSFQTLGMGKDMGNGVEVGD
jgi:hypothetical protein